MQMIQRLARGGASEAQKQVTKLLRQRAEKIVELGGDFIYMAPTGPLDDAQYDDPHKPKPRRPLVDDDLEGWEPLR